MRRKFLIWGGGFRGQLLCDFLGSDCIVAFIDQNVDLIGTKYKGVPIVEFATYIRDYSQYFIIISMIKPDEVKDILVNQGISSYFLLTDCPEELQGYGDFNSLKRLKRTFDKTERYVIYGINLFSVLVYDFMRACGVDVVTLIPQKSLDNRIQEGFKKIFADIPISTVIPENDRILCTTNKADEDYLKSDVHLKARVENYYDFSNRIENYYNSDLTKYKFKHAGERCFIVATGPSLQMKDLEKLRECNEMCFSMNRVYCAFNNTIWRPNYYVVSDRVMICEHLDDILNLDLKDKFIADRSFLLSVEDQERLQVPSINRFHIKGLEYLRGNIMFSSDCRKGCYEGGTVTYICLQLAVYMGFKEIYLIGVDCNYLGARPSKQDYFCSNYMEDSRKGNATRIEDSIIAYQVAKDYADAHGIKIYNATRGGKLEVFERVEFDSLF